MDIQKYKRYPGYIAAAIKDARTKNNISQRKLSLMTGLTRATIGAIENGRNIPNLFTLLRIADALNMRASEIIGDIEKRIYKK